MTRFYVFSTLLSLVLSVHSVQPIGTLFNVDTSNTNNKGCATYAGQLDQIIADCSKLAAAGVSLMNNYNTDSDGAARRTVDSWFRQPTDAQRAEILRRFRGVQNFVDNNAGGPQPKPYLFCGSGWLVRGDASDQARDNQGNLILDNNRNPKPISGLYAAEIADARAVNGGRAVFPYWSQDLRQYIFDVSYGGPAKGYCDDSKSQGVTQDIIQPNTITLCTRSFIVGPTRPARNAALGGIDPNPDSPAAMQLQQENDPSQQLQWKQGIPDVACSALTLFHELFHLVFGSAATPDVGDSYQLPQILEINSAQAELFPESYTLAAESYWYTLNKQSDGQRVDYATGKCLFSSG